MVPPGQRHRRPTPAGRDSRRLPGLDPFNTIGERRLAQLGQPGRRRRPVQQRRHPRHPHPGDGADHRPQRGPKLGPAVPQPRHERLRILGEIPVRKFGGDKQPLDPDGNPDTSFLAKIPADAAFTFQTLDKNGMVLNMAQTWHQLRPGEIRNDCGGCHAHSQKPTLFKQTAAARPDYPVFDLTKQTPLLTDKKNDQSGKKWDANERDRPALRTRASRTSSIYRDVKPILDRSCVACHTQKSDQAGRQPGPGRRQTMHISYVGKRARHLLTGWRWIGEAKFGHKPVIHNGHWRQTNASRYVRMFQSRRSLLVWKIFGRRTDGWNNDDFPHETLPGDANTLDPEGPAGGRTRTRTATARTLIYNGNAMPPADAVAGTYQGPDGKAIKVAALSDEDRRTLVRWIDLGCPIDLDYDPAKPQAAGYGWMLDDSPADADTDRAARRKERCGQSHPGRHGRLLCGSGPGQLRGHRRFSGHRHPGRAKSGENVQSPRRRCF